MKDIDSFAVSQYVRILFWCLFSSLFISTVLAYRMGSLVPILVGILISIVASVPLLFVINRISDTFGSLYSGRGTGATLQEQLAGELIKGKHLKSEKRFAEALQTVNRILEQMPEYAEALLLKAQILSEGFANNIAAKDCLKKLIRLESVPNETTRQWAKGMLEDIDMKLRKEI